MKTIEPLYTERYVQWCGRSATQLMGSLLPDQSFALTDEQIKELEEILEKSRERGTESTDKEGGAHA